MHTHSAHFYFFCFFTFKNISRFSLPFFIFFPSFFFFILIPFFLDCPYLSFSSLSFLPFVSFLTPPPFSWFILFFFFPTCLPLFYSSCWSVTGLLCKSLIAVTLLFERTCLFMVGDGFRHLTEMYYNCISPPSWVNIFGMIYQDASPPSPRAAL